MSIEPPLPPGAPPATSTPTVSPAYAWAAAALAGLTALGGFYLSLGEGKFPCPLCFYQRSFALAVFGVLLIGLLGGMASRVSLATLALPLAVAGLGVALWHVDLERKGALECPAGLFGIRTAPQQSMVAFALLCAILILDTYQPGRVGNTFAAIAGAIVLGLALATVCVNPGVNDSPAWYKKVPAEEYEKPPTICRKPLTKNT
jgi:disulfide bond formation protein DsbB